MGNERVILGYPVPYTKSPQNRQPTGGCGEDPVGNQSVITGCGGGRKCPACRRCLLAVDFYKDSTRASGASALCRTCYLAAARHKRFASRAVAFLDNRDDDGESERLRLQRMAARKGTTLVDGVS